MGLERFNTRGGGLILTIDGVTITRTPAQMDRVLTGGTLKASLELQLGRPLNFNIFLHKNRDGFNEVALYPIGESAPTRPTEDEPNYVPRRTRTRT